MKKILFVMLVCCVLSGCAATKRWLGLGKTDTSDETKVETRAPLVLPPNFDELP